VKKPFDLDPRRRSLSFSRTDSLQFVDMNQKFHRKSLGMLKSFLSMYPSFPARSPHTSDVVYIEQPFCMGGCAQRPGYLIPGFLHAHVPPPRINNIDRLKHPLSSMYARPIPTQAIRGSM